MRRTSIDGGEDSFGPSRGPDDDDPVIAQSTPYSRVELQTAIVLTLATGVAFGPGDVPDYCRRALLAFGAEACSILCKVLTDARFSGAHRDELQHLLNEMSRCETSMSLPHVLLAAFLAEIDCENEQLSGLAGETMGKINPRVADILATEALRHPHNPGRQLRFLKAAERTGERLESTTLKLRLFHLAAPGYPEIRQVAQRLACIRPMPDCIDTSLIDPVGFFNFSE